MEYPSEAQIWLRLGYALSMFGFRNHGARGYSKEGCDYFVYDVEHNSKNEYFIEALSIFQKVLCMGELSPDDRAAVIPLMVRQYAIMGAYDKAEEIAKRQNPVMISRECLLPDATEGEKRDMYQGEALLALIKELKKAMDSAVMTKRDITQNEVGVQKLLGVAHLYELILDDGNCGEYHFDLMDLYRWCAVYTARQGNISKAMEFFDTCYLHAQKYEAIRGQIAFRYTAPLISKVVVPCDKWPKAPAHLWEGWLQRVAPSNLLEEIRKHDRYKECFE